MRNATKLLQPAKAVPQGFTSLSVPVHRASTVTFSNADTFAARREGLYDGYTYGLYSTPRARRWRESWQNSRARNG